eukprot:6459626-Amphidinium_carterae.2
MPIQGQLVHLPMTPTCPLTVDATRYVRSSVTRGATAFQPGEGLQGGGGCPSCTPGDQACIPSEHTFTQMSHDNTDRTASAGVLAGTWEVEANQTVAKTSSQTR